MGTSVNQRSPDTPNWRLVQSVYDDPGIPIEDVLREVWRAASNVNETNLATLLAQPDIGSFVTLAITASSPIEAFQEITRFISDRKISSLASDIAKRAVIQSAGKQDAAELFVQRLFAEATNYLVSRDLPGHVTPGSRLGSVSEAQRFTQEIMNTAVDAVRRTPSPSSLTEEWTSYVRSVISTMRRRQRLV